MPDNREKIVDFYSDLDFKKSYKEYKKFTRRKRCSDATFYTIRKELFPDRFGDITLKKTKEIKEVKAIAPDHTPEKAIFKPKRNLGTYDILLELPLDNDANLFDVLDDLIEKLSTSLGIKLSTETLINPKRIEVRRFIK